MFVSQQLLEEIKNVNFCVNETHIKFDKNGDPRIGYDIMHWEINSTTQHAEIKSVGQYWPDENITFPDYLVDRVDVRQNHV